MTEKDKLKNDFFDGKLDEKEEKKVKDILLTELSAEGDMYRSFQKMKGIRYPAKSKNNFREFAIATLVLMTITTLLYIAQKDEYNHIQQWATLNSFEKLELIHSNHFSISENKAVIALVSQEEDINVRVALLHLIEPDPTLNENIRQLISEEQSPVVAHSLKSLVTATNHIEE